MPSSSIGFCVARTKNGCSSGYVRPGGRDVVLLHGFEQRGLRFRRRPVDFVGEDDLCEDRPFHEPQRSVSALLVQYLGSRDIRGHQIRRELNALERQIQYLGDGLDEERLGEAGHAGDQAMPTGEERHQDLVDDGILSDDHLANLGEDALTSVGDAFGDRGNIRLCACRRIERRIHRFSVSGNK